MTTRYILNGGSKCLAWTIMDSANLPLERFGAGKKYWDVDCPRVQVPMLASRTVDSSYLRDIIPVNLEFAVSADFCDSIKWYDVDPKMILQDVEIVNNRGKTLNRTYKLLYAHQWHHVLNVRDSNAKVFDDGIIDSIDRWVLSEKLLPKYDLFCAHCLYWIVSESLAERLGCLTNVELIEAEVSD